MLVLNPEFVLFPDLCKNKYNDDNIKIKDSIINQVILYFKNKNITYVNDINMTDISKYTFIFPYDLSNILTTDNKNFILKNHKFLITGNPKDITNEILNNSREYLQIIELDIQRFYNSYILNF